jgi:hypothetical protein
MGNRGVIHTHKQITKPFKHKAWITCALEFKGRKRTVMMHGRWTELFFLDEATALRPVIGLALNVGRAMRKDLNLAG